MNIMVLRSSPEWQKLVQTPRELVAAVRIDGLEQPAYDPEVHSQNVQVASDGAPQDRSAHGAET